ncbi:hypothetical protein SLEP1_g57335 [Rubroshorea leprosula]|uniref:Uncharacterized protein n=1 Tax=Rubroshorea leprosula TaxID=152421 RepID=A0AAV5MNR2_9ROSI|nr:hypothetical protein SLEP1_g57335 [Rubroshorea leprosula]
MAAALVPSALELIAIVETAASLEGVKVERDSKYELQRLGNNLVALNAIFEDAEQEGGTNIAIEDWMDNGLTDAAYDLVDVLDEWITAHMMKLRIKAVGLPFMQKGKVSSYITHRLRTAQVARRDNLAFKLKDISDRLDDIAGSYNLHLISNSVFQHSSWIRSTALVDASAIIGRDKVKGHIVSCLLSASTEKLKTISVLGMRGVGKTAIAQLVYQDELVKQHFDHRIWVCVSEVFDQKNVAKTIIKGVEGVISFQGVDSLDSFPLSALLDRICRSIHGKKFFLVLDDVWVDDKRHWEGLIQTVKHGAAGSRILLTTRKDTVADMMLDSHVIRLEPLSDEQCWMIVSREAFSGRGAEKYQNLEDIRKRISNKCRGLPLAAKVLGALLRSDCRREEWEKILNSEILGFGIPHREFVVSVPLWYSYLPLPLRKCLKYCAIFPKDFEFNGETIIYHWMAQGYLGWNSREDLESKGREYISYLAAHSFFQDFLMDEDGLKSTWKMHDIMHDFSRFLMINNGIVIEVMNPRGNSMIDLSSTKARYLIALIPEGCCLPTSIYGAEKLHSLVIISGENAITNEAVQIIFNQAKRLRLVDFGCHNALVDTIPKEIGNLIHLRHINLCGSKIKGLPRPLCELHNLQYLNLDNSESLENLPDEIGNLINLRHMNFSGSKIKGLPGSLCKLHNLRYLNLDNCKALENLPSQIGKLFNLTYLGTLHCYRLACYPKSARRLTDLRQLRGIVLRADRNDPKEFTLGDLENLNQLCELSMVLKGNAVNDRELRRAKFENKTHLKEIKVE